MILSLRLRLQDTVLAVSDLRQRFIDRNQSDLRFDHISHVVTSVCYLLGTIFQIKSEVLREFKLFDLRAVVAMKNPRWRRRTAC